MKFLGFGNGSNGDLSISSPTTDNPVDSACSGTSGSSSLTATNASFAAGQILLVIQNTGTGAGNYEVIKCQSYTTGTITTETPLENTYTNDSTSHAQVLVIPQYGNVNISSTLTAKAWNGTVGGVVTFMASGKTTVTGTITAKSKGFREGSSRDTSTGQPASYAVVGENKSGSQPYQEAEHNGGGGAGTLVDETNSAGGGGGHATAGTAGDENSSSNQGGGNGGSTYGNSDLSTIFFGAGGGGYTYGGKPPIAGTAGGGIVLIFSRQLDCSSGYIDTSATSVDMSSGEVSGGNGAGGSTKLVCVSATLGNNRVISLGGVTFNTGAGDVPGGNGGDGRNRVEACSVTGTTNPTMSQQNGQSYCSSLTFIY